MKRYTICLCLTPLMTLAAGCVSDTKARLPLGSNVLLDTGEGDGVAGSAPSVRGLDRSNWGATTIRVPVDGTVHRATYTRTVLYDDSLARQKGLFPTAETALETEGDRGMGAAEIAAQPGWALIDAALIPIRVAMSPPWKPVQSPRVNYKRTRPGGWLTGGAAPTGPEATEAPVAPSQARPGAVEVEEVDPDA
ncbi:MAG: hypothetical protein ACIARR_03855 [Phycisphaerales bacterium JB059]